MATAPDGMTILAVTPVNFEEIIERSQNTGKEPYTEDQLREMMTQARAKNNVAMVMFMGPDFWHKEERQGLAIHDTLR
jgi:hypothetical protein